MTIPRRTVSSSEGVSPGSNEGLSLVENAAYLGLPIPVKLRKVLEQLHDRSEKEDGGKEAVEDKKDGEN